MRNLARSTWTMYMCFIETFLFPLNRVQQIKIITSKLHFSIGFLLCFKFYYCSQKRLENLPNFRLFDSNILLILLKLDFALKIIVSPDQKWRRSTPLHSLLPPTSGGWAQPKHNSLMEISHKRNLNVLLCWLIVIERWNWV